jgi:hypothetical protein
VLWLKSSEIFHSRDFFTGAYELCEISFAFLGAQLRDWPSKQHASDFFIMAMALVTGQFLATKMSATTF